MTGGLSGGKLTAQKEANNFRVKLNWYFEDYSSILNKEYSSYIKDGMDSLQAMNKIREEHSEASEEFLSKIFA